MMAPMSDVNEVDLVVIGAGPGGEALAGGAAAAGLEVVVVDRHLVGGECPYYGCIPVEDDDPRRGRPRRGRAGSPGSPAT